MRSAKKEADFGREQIENNRWRSVEEKEKHMDQKNNKSDSFMPAIAYS